MTSSEPAPAGVVEPPQRRRRRIALGLGGTLLGVCVALIVFARVLPSLLVERQAPKTADAIVVLAGDHTGGRTDHAFSLFQAGHLPQGPVVMSGGPIYGVLTWAALMRDRAVALGIPSDRVSVQARSTTTVEDARMTLELVPQVEGRATVVLLVTSAWHSGRAAEHFREVAGDRFEIVSCPAPDPPPEWWRSAVATRAIATEVLKRLWPGPGG